MTPLPSGEGGGREKLEEFLHHLNALRPSIKFTMKLEKNDQLPFLHGCISKEEGEPPDNCLQKEDTHRSLHPFDIQPPPKHQTRSHEVPENSSREDM